MISLAPLLGWVFTVMCVPMLIVIFWKRRPVWAMILAMVILFLTIVIPNMYSTYQMITYSGAADPAVVSGAMAQTITTALIGSLFGLPILCLARWIARRRWKHRLVEADAKDMFS